MAYWPLNENSGTVIQDSSNNTNYGLIQKFDMVITDDLSIKDIFSKKIIFDGSGKNWVADYQIKDGDVVDGAMEFQITGFQDIAGNALLSPSILTEDDHQKSVAVDTSSPRVLTTSIASTNTNIDPSLGANTLLAKAGDTITVKFTTDERIKDPTATINENMVEVRPQSDDDSGKKWEFDYDVVDGINIDQTPFQITGADDSHGNALVAFPEATTDNASKFVRIDTKKPEIQNIQLASTNFFTQWDVNKLAKASDNITLSFTASEDINTPQILFAGQTLQASKVDGTRHEWELIHGVSDADPNGLFQFTISYQDPVGNSGDNITNTSDGSLVTIDTINPQLDNITIASSNSVPSLANQNDTITLTFDTTEIIETPVVKILGYEADSVVQGNHANQWVAIYRVTEGDDQDPFKESLVAHYPLNGNTIDGVGFNDATEKGEFTSSIDRFGVEDQSYSFDGSNYLEVDYNSDLNPSIFNFFCLG